MNNRVAVLAIILVSYLMIVLDISIVITVLPKVQNELVLHIAESHTEDGLLPAYETGFVALRTYFADEQSNFCLMVPFTVRRPRFLPVHEMGLK